MRMSKKSFAFFMALGTACVSAHAAPVTSWDYILVNEFTGANFSSTGGDQNVSQRFINWGSPTGPSDPRSNSDRSGLELAGQTVNGAGQAQTSGSYTTNDFTNPGVNPTISHINNPISSIYGTLTNASLFASLTLTPSNPAGPTQAPIDINFLINFSETLNNPPCVATSTTPCADIFVIGSDALNTEFTYDNEDYFISIFELSNALFPLSSAVCSAAGAVSPCLGFVTQEGQVNEARFGFVITNDPVSVPEPAALGLIGLGLSAFGLSRRKKQAA